MCQAFVGTNLYLLIIEIDKFLRYYKNVINLPKELFKVMYNILTQKKVISSFILAAMLAFVSSCGYKETENLVEDKTENRTEDSSGSKELEDETDHKQEEVVPEVGSNQTVAVRYGEVFSDCGLSVSGDMLYNYGSAPEDNSLCIAEMPEEGQQLSWNYIELPDHMEIRQLTTDYQGKFHILLMEVEKIIMNGEEFNVPTYEVSYIWTVNREGEVERKLDVSDIFARIQRTPTNLMIDVEGNYYFDNENEVIRLNPDGDITMRWSLEGYEIEALACGKSGKIYCIYEDYQGRDILELLEEDRIACLCISLPEYDCKYCCMAAGVDAELLIFNLQGGVSAYADGAHTVEQRIVEEDMPVSGEEAHVHRILSDGRLWMRVYDKETKGCTFYYIPTVAGGEK